MKRRKLTPFLAREMLYDYATNQLDTSRKQAVEEFLESDRESKALLLNIQAAISYSKKLSETQVDAQILSQLKEAESAISLGKKYSSWSAWPETLRWSITALGLSALVAGVVSVVPWSRFSQKVEVKPGQTETIEVAQIPTGTPDPLEAQNVADNEGSGDEPPGDGADDGPGEEGSGDEHDEGEALPAHVAAKIAARTPEPTPSPKPTLKPAPTATAIAKATATPAQSPTATAAVASKPEPVMGPRKYDFVPYFLARRNPLVFFDYSYRYIPNFIVPPFNAVEPPPVAVQVAKQTPKPSPTPKAVAAVSQPKLDEGVNPGDNERSESEAGDEKPKGFVYRAFMTLPNLEEISPKIAEDLESLGAEKAGEVELGWKRGTGRYFHFALPAENEKKALEKLQVYGPVRISKDPHPRIMPPGQVRFILWIESAN